MPLTNQKYLLPYAKDLEKLNLHQITNAFPDLAQIEPKYTISLIRYTRNIPEKFYRKRVYYHFKEWLNATKINDNPLLMSHLNDSHDNISDAFIALNSINAEAWHDSNDLYADDYSSMKTIDGLIHPNYVKLSESVLAPLLKTAAHVSRLKRGKGTSGLDIYNIIQELRGQDVVLAASRYIDTIRNGISHGGVKYHRDHVQYLDKKKSHLCTYQEMADLFEGLLDDCNAVAAAIKEFYISNHTQGYIIPKQLFIEIIQEEFRHDWWRIEGCLDSTTADNKKQLVIYASPNTLHKSMVSYMVVQVALAAGMLMPEYDSYFISMKSPKILPSWAYFDRGAIDIFGHLIKHDSLPPIVPQTNYSYLYLPRVNVPGFLSFMFIISDYIKKQLYISREMKRIDTASPNIRVRETSLHRNGWRLVVNSRIVVEGANNREMKQFILKNASRIIRASVRHSKQKSNSVLYKFMLSGFVLAHVYCEDFRRRKINRYGLGEALVCTITMQKIKRIKNPDILNSTIEYVSGYRIAWNKQWLMKQHDS